VFLLHAPKLFDYAALMKRIAIIGGGISGLSAAYVLEQHRRAGVPLQYVLYESSPRLGGVLRTEHVEGCLVEAGPDSFLTEKPWASDLCRELGIGDQLIGSNDAERKTYILVRGRLVPMPDGLLFMVPIKILPSAFSQLFSFSTKLRIIGEWFHSPKNSDSDESVAALVQRHYGSEMVERVADPLLAGVYGGDASQLSVRAVLPRLREMESEYGSLGRGMLEAFRKQRKEKKQPIFTSIENGMQQIADAIVGRLPGTSIRLSDPAVTVRYNDKAWSVAAGGAEQSFDSVIMALQAPTAGKLLRVAHNELASELSAISYSSSVIVALAFDERVRAALPPGFGFLVPRSEGERILAVTFVHNKFSYRSPDNRALLRCFLGGSRDEQAIELSEEEIVRVVRRELRQILGVTADPLFTRVYKWKDAMAQYNVGHLERLEKIAQLRRNLPGLALCGNAYRGIGVPDCVRSGKEAAESVMSFLGLPIPPLIT
jgi:oxygen-dependent protoporphyrinogen oxidase